MVVDAEGAWPLPWLAEPVARALQQQRGHALLLHAAPGVGALPFALTLAQAWLCEGDAPPCGRCASCRLVQAHLHPDLQVLLPEALRREHGWLLAGDKADGDDAKRKPSRQIRIDEVRALIDWSTKTSARGRGKVAVLHPAEALNLQSASALLKTLEEPPPGTRLVLTAADPARLLPTVLSRCQRQRLAPPLAAQASAWLQQRAGIDAEAAAVLLAACSGAPLQALALHESGVDAAAWAALPQAVAQGHAAALAGWPVPRALDALHKLCHDLMALGAGAAPRFFPRRSLGPSARDAAALAAWSRELDRVARAAEHPWHEGLLLEALVRAGAQAMAGVQPGIQPGVQPGAAATLR